MHALTSRQIKQELRGTRFIQTHTHHTSRWRLFSVGVPVCPLLLAPEQNTQTTSSNDPNNKKKQSKNHLETRFSRPLHKFRSEGPVLPGQRGAPLLEDSHAALHEPVELEVDAEHRRLAGPEHLVSGRRSLRPTNQPTNHRIATTIGLVVVRAILGNSTAILCERN